jgi:predicted dehydrogenase
MPPVRVGILGLSFMGAAHFHIYRAHPRARVTAVSDINARRLRGDWRGIAGNIGPGRERVGLSGVAAYIDFNDLIADPNVDLVDICLPINLHEKAAVAALAAGKHVLCEKPLAIDLKQCDLIVAAAKKARGKFMTAMCVRFWPEWLWLKREVVDRRRYGKVLSVTLQRHSATPRSPWITDARISGSAAYEMHVHDTDFVQFLFGSIRSVSSRGIRGKVTRGGWDYIDTCYDVPGCPHVRAEGGFAYEPGWAFWWEYKVQCERATVFHTLRPAAELKVFHADGRVEDVRIKPKKYQETGWSAEIDYFLGCIVKNKPVKMVTPEEARNAIAVVNAEVDSAGKGGKWVRPRLV